MNTPITSFSLKQMFLFMGLIFLLMSASAQVSIKPNNQDPDPSAMLDVQSQNKGFLMPRLTTDQRDAISDPAAGLYIYNLDDSCFNYYTGKNWLKDCGRELDMDSFGASASSTTNNSSVSFLADGPGNSVYLIGYFTDDVSWGDQSLSDPGRHVYVARFDPTSGGCSWIKTIADDNTEALDAVSDQEGNVYVVGYNGTYGGTFMIGDSSFSNTGFEESFILKIDADGNFPWAKHWGGLSITTAASLDPNNDLVIAGTYLGSISIESQTLSSSGPDDIFLAKVDKNGSLIWAENGFVTDTDPNTLTYVWGMDIDAQGHIHAAGLVDGSATFGTTTISSPSPGNTKGVIVRFDANGHGLDALELSAGTLAEAREIVLDDNGNRYVSGKYSGSMTLGSTALPSGGDYRFVTKVAPNGTFLWALSSVAPGNFPIASEDIFLDLDESGQLYTLERYRNSLNFGGQSFSSPGSYTNVVVTHIDANGNLIWSQESSGAGNVSIGDLIYSPAGKVYVGGSAGGATGSKQLGETDIPIATGIFSGFVWPLNTEDGGTAFNNQLGGSQDNDRDASNELQSLSLAGNTLSISDGNSVNLNTLNQTLGLVGNTLSITNGNSVTLPAEVDGDVSNELQSLSLLGNTLSISNGNSISLPAEVDGDASNELQSLSLSNNTLSISDGNSVNLSTVTSNTDSQTLHLEGTELSISNGNTVNLSNNVLSEGGLILDSCVLTTGLTINNYGGGGFTYRPDGWQGFQATHDGYLRRFDAGLFVPINGYLRVYEGEGISGTLLYQDTLSANQSPFFFPELSIALAKDSLYTVQLIDTASLLGWTFQGGNPYPPSISSIGQDYNFRVYQDTCSSLEVLTVNNGGTVSFQPVQQLTFADGTVQTTAPVNQTLGLSNNVLSISNGNSVNLLDNDPLNELQDWTTLPNIPTDFSDNIDNVDDADADSQNELQTLTILANVLSISDGNSVNLPVSHDNDSTNELQMLSFSQDTLSLSNGNQVVLDSLKDNLGDHTARTNISLNGNWLSKDGDNEGLFVDSLGNIGLGTASPQAHLHLDGGQVLMRGELVPFYNGAIPDSGSGTRLMWIPQKAAFRVGNAVGNIWDPANIGYFSTVSGGSNNRASGGSSFVGGGMANTASSDGSVVVGGRANFATATRSFVGGGEDNEASGLESFMGAGFDNTVSGERAFVGSGRDNHASGNNSFIGAGETNHATGNRTFVGGGNNNDVLGNYSLIVGGVGNTVSGNYAVVGGGEDNTASGSHSFVGGGEGNTAPSYGESVVGLFAETYTAASPTSFQDNDRLFVVGNGTSSGVRSNALTILKNGNMGLGTSSPQAQLHMEGGQALMRGDFVSTYNGAIPDSGAGTRLMWVPEKAAFRVGQVDGSQWDLANMGDYSTVAGGYNNIASGFNSVVGGGKTNIASGRRSFVGSGDDNEASGIDAFIGGGFNNTVSGNRSFVGGGSANSAVGDNSFIGGGGDNNAIGDFSYVGGGSNNDALGILSLIAGGEDNTATSNFSFVGGGEKNSVSGEYATISGGEDNSASKNFSFIGGGRVNAASGLFASIVGGNNIIASGDYSSVGGGINHVASGDNSVVGGGNTNAASEFSSFVGGGLLNAASGQFSSIGGGNSNAASGFYSFVGGGNSNTASGYHSFVGGGNANTAPSYGEAVLGLFAETYTPASPITFEDSDRLFVVGNGKSNTVRSNALTILKSGHMGIGSSTPLERLDVNGAIRLGNTDSINEGTIRYTGADFEGYDGEEWKSLTHQADFVEGKYSSSKKSLEIELLDSTLVFPSPMLWQSFTATKTALLCQLDLNWNQSVPNVTLSIYEGEGISGNLLLSQNILATIGFQSYELDSLLPLTAGNQYTFQVSSSTTLELRGDPTSTYSGGKPNITVPGLFPNADIGFRVYQLLTTNYLCANNDNLSLLNNSLNILPNGNVGIGIATPAVNLDLGTSGGRKLALYQNGSGLNFYGFGISPNTLEIHAGSNNSTPPKMVIRNDGNVGIGAINPLNTMDISGGLAIGKGYAGNHAAPSDGAIIEGTVGIGTSTPDKAKLEISGSLSYPISNQVGILNNSSPAALGNLSVPFAYSIYADSRIAATVFHAFSDVRIKNVQGISNSQTDLSTLMQIEVTDYRLRDSLTKGNRPIKKVIAQQVAEVYPQAVTNNLTEVIPDIYKRAEVQEGWIMLATDLKPGERVKLITEHSSEIYEVLEAEPTRFKVSTPSTELRTSHPSDISALFVYGREVDDFHTVDYEAISMLNVSATQAQQQLIEQQQQTIETLTKQLKAQQLLHTKMQDQNAAFEARLQVLEMLLKDDAFPPLPANSSDSQK